MRALRHMRVSTVLVAALFILSLVRVADLYGGSLERDLRVGLVFDPTTLADESFIRDAYDSVLEEEGIARSWISTRDLLLLDGGELARRFETLIFPDGLVQQMPAATLDRGREFMREGGNIVVVLDAGVKDTEGDYRSGGVMAPLVGVQYQRYRSQRDDAYIEGNLDFSTPALTSAWQIPPGKLHEGHVVGGYSYGRLRYPMASAEVTHEDVELFASFDGIPVLSERSFGRGRALWVNLPLGYLKAYGDDLPLRTVLRSYLFDVVGMPHLVSSPGGVGGLVMDWHIDSQIEWEGIPSLISSGVLRSGLRQQFDVTAGPFRDRQGDGLGFDACGEGQEHLEALLPFGEIGSHGGWSHNYFSDQLENSKLTEAQLRDAIVRNEECLESVTQREVSAYSAPNGVHPPVVTRLLEERGINAYYYTGDSGSAPNRTFLDGARVSDDAWAFPVMPNGLYASVGEMIKAGLSPREVEQWLVETLDYVGDQRTVRLLYSHPYDLSDTSYLAVYNDFLDTAESLQSRGLLRVEPMTYFADFMSRFVETEFSFT
ncbi:MAG: polysaccharide deacetylase family protein, partial [Actinomycetota bacterium]